MKAEQIGLNDWAHVPEQRGRQLQDQGGHVVRRGHPHPSAPGAQQPHSGRQSLERSVTQELGNQLLRAQEKGIGQPAPRETMGARPRAACDSCRVSACLSFSSSSAKRDDGGASVTGWWIGRDDREPRGSPAL